MKLADNRSQESKADARSFSAPGRVNIIGEHTDYNDGFVLPTNTALYTTVTATPRDGTRIRVHSSVVDETAVFDADDDRFESPVWLKYVGGVAAIIRRNGIPVTGADLEIDGDIPLGGGLSSSASLELAVGHALVTLNDQPVEAETLARWCQDAEREFAGVNCGIMDQYSVACGKYGEAMLLDCRSLDTAYAAIPASVALLVVDSGVKHALPDSGYNDRADECRRAVKVMRDTGNDIESLRDANPEMLDAARRELGDVLYRRAMHVVTENARTLDAFDALRKAQPNALGRLVSESHRSLREDYEVSCDEVDELVRLTEACAGVHGARMVGAGFGGCILAVVDAPAITEVEREITNRYKTPAGESPWTHIVAPAPAASETPTT